MTTTVASLVDRVRDLLGDYGDNELTITAAVTDTSGTGITLESSESVKKGDYLNIDYELMYVSSVPTGPPYSTVVRRGQHGSTAATHSNGAMVLVNPIYPSSRILADLNAALGKMTKQVKDLTTLTFVDDQYVYAIPATIDTIKRLEVENSDEGGEFYTIRDWEMRDGGYFRVFGDYQNTRNIGVVGTAKFTAMAASGSLDTTYPDDNPNAINFLIYEAAGQLLLQRQGKIAGRDSFVGMTDSFGANYPDHSVRVARQYLAEAGNYRRYACNQEPILQTPVSVTQHPTRSYLART